MKKLNKNQKGFTIIEVLIVLAIAGLILLIVFLAVPALQRNTRNNARTGDIGRFGASVSEYLANRNGVQPTEANMGEIMTAVGSMGGYNAAADRQPTVAGNQGILGAAAGQPRFRLVTGATCNVADGTTTATTQRRATIQYQLETANNAAHTNLCREI